MKNFFFK